MQYFPFLSKKQGSIYQENNGIYNPVFTARYLPANPASKGW